MRIASPSWQFDVDQEWLDVTSDAPTPNESWREVDANGHEHYYNRGYPTLTFVIDSQHWCDGSEGWMHHDPHWHVDEAHYECRECGIVITPSMDPGGKKKYIPGMRTARLSGVRSDGVRIVMTCTEDEVARVTTDRELAQSVLDSAPAERISEWSLGEP